MKNLMIMIGILCLLTACKTRQVAIQKKDSTNVKTSVASTSVQLHVVDTSKETQRASIQQTQHVVLTDSSGTVTVITPVDSSSVTVGPDGVFYGRAKSITTTRHDRKTEDSQDNTNTELLLYIQHRIDSLKTVNATLMKRDSTHVDDMKKNIVAKPDYGFMRWLIPIGAIIAVGIVITRRLKFV